MDELTTVFEITAGSNGVRADALLRVGIGLAVLIGGAFGLFRAYRTEERSLRKLVGPACVTAWSVVWIIAHIPLWRIGVTQTNRLLEIHHNGKSQVVAGIVHVSHEQPAHGHSSGDKIFIGDQKFEVNYFRVTPGYNKTIAHGGVLREGVFARLHYYEGVILKVEVGSKKMGNSSIEPKGGRVVIPLEQFQKNWSLLRMNLLAAECLGGPPLPSPLLRRTYRYPHLSRTL